MALGSNGSLRLVAKGRVCGWGKRRARGWDTSAWSGDSRFVIDPALQELPRSADWPGVFQVFLNQGVLKSMP